MAGNRQQQSPTTTMPLSNAINFLFAFGWHREAPLLLFLSFLFAVLLYSLRPMARKSLRRMGLGIIACWFGLRLAVALPQQGYADVGSVINEISVITVGILLIQLWSKLLFQLLAPLLRWSPPKILHDLTLTLAYIAWGIVRLRYAGLELSQLFTTSAVITAVLAFSMQDTLGNILAGMALQLDDSIEVGDWIKADDVAGRVVDIGWRATRIETRNWETVVLPNSALMKNKFTVLGKRHNAPMQWRRTVTFDVSLETLPAQIIHIAEEALRECQLAHVAREPAPNCILVSLENGVGHFAVRYWLTDFGADDATDSTVRALLDAALRRHGRHLSAMQYNVTLTRENDRFFAARHQRHTQERVATLRQLELFRPLHDDELQDLANRLKFTPFVTGDTIVRQGVVADWLYILISGEVEILLEHNGNGSQSLGRLQPGHVFGEMGLMTGTPTSATVIARSSVECYRLDRTSFKNILLARQELADELSQLLEKRLGEQNKHLSNAASPPKQTEIVARLRRFLGLVEG